MATEEYRLAPGLNYFLVREIGKLWWIELQAESAFRAREKAIEFFAVHERYPARDGLEVFLCDRPVTKIVHWDGKPSLQLVKDEHLPGEETPPPNPSK